MDAVSFIITLFIIVITFLWFRFYYSTSRSFAKLPQFKGHILLGNLELFTGKLFAKHTIPLYQRVLNGFNHFMADDVRNANVFLFWLAFSPYAVMTNAKSVEQLLTSSKLIEKSSDYKFLKPWLATGLLTSGGDKWRSRRKFITPSFHFRILNEFMPIMNKHSRVLVNKFKEHLNESLNIVNYLQMETLDVICETAMGVSIEAQAGPESKYAQAVISVSDAIFNRVFQFQYWVDFVYYKTKSGRRFKQLVHYLQSFTDEVIKSRKEMMLEEFKNKGNETERKEDDDSLFFGKRKNAVAFMDLLIKRHLEGLNPDGSSDFTLEDIREEVDTFMFEGFDTTSSALTWTLHLLGHNPEVQDKAYEEIYSIFGDDVERQITEADLHKFKYVEMCIKEALRIYPSVPLFLRRVSEDVDICGYTIPKGTTIGVYTHGLHRDPKVFPDPEKYIPERFSFENSLNRSPFAYIPFSAGPRNCIGQKFAMMELKVIITEILRNFKLQSLNENIAISVDLITKAREAVLVKFIARQ